MRWSPPLPTDLSWERAVRVGRRTARQRLKTLETKRWHVVQCALAAGVAWFLARDVFGHPMPVFAPIAAVVSLGTSYGQRLRRVVEVTLGVAIGVFLGDILVQVIGSGTWQLVFVVTLAMIVAILGGGNQLTINQACVQSIFVTTSLATADEALVRWTDALIGGAVALVAASLVPAAPLRRPQEQAAVVVRKVAELLRAVGEVVREADAVHGMAVLADARRTDALIRELESAAAEGMSVVASSPFRVRHRPHVRRMAELVEPLDRAIRSTRVLVRQAAVAAYRGSPVPESYADLATRLADAAEVVAEQLASHESLADQPVYDGLVARARPLLLEVGRQSGEVERSGELNAEVILLQLRSVLVDLLQITGMGQYEATDSLPPVRMWPGAAGPTNAGERA